VATENSAMGLYGKEERERRIVMVDIRG